MPIMKRNMRFYGAECNDNERGFSQVLANMYELTVSWV